MNGGRETGQGGVPQDTAGGEAGRPALIWFTQDLRLADNPALRAAMAGGRAVLPVYILDETASGSWAPGGAARWWLHHSLAALGVALEAVGSKLVLRRGEARREIPRLAAESGAVSVHVAQAHEPWARALLDRVGSSLATGGVQFYRHPGRLLFEPSALRTQAGGVFGVFSPFARACHGIDLPDTELPTPARIPGGFTVLSDRLADWDLLPTAHDWAGGLRATWQPGEAGAQSRLARFFAGGFTRYDRMRDRPDIAGTSTLSPHLQWGEISPRQVWLAAGRAAPEGGKFLRRFRDELLWREFSAYLLWHHPRLPEAPLRTEFAAMPWRHDPRARAAWQRGRTGIPMIDAGMRQLRQIGWMHNRVRMVVASFLVKHLLIPWQDGEAWFWDTLVDADLASNSANWQWVAGCGTDAAPYFRIFNPVLQGRKFDPDGTYIRRFVPELGRLPDAHLHAPWTAPTAVLDAAGVALGETYPWPIIELAAGRARALAAYAALSRPAA